MTGEELQRAREQLGMSQTELARRLGVTQNTISRWEIGKHKIPQSVELAIKEIQRTK